MQPLSGAWSRRNREPAPVLPDYAQLSPDHLNPPAPSANYVGERQPWQSNADAPILPDELYGPDGTPQLVVGGGPLDLTPEGGDWGLAVGPGLTRFESQDRSGEAADTDTGSVAARMWHPSVEVDGANHVIENTNHFGDGDSPGTLAFQRTGVEGPYDGGVSRASKRIKRWRDRFIDRHDFEPERRPRQTKSATVAVPQLAVPDGGPTVSPFPNAAAWYAGPHDRFVEHQVRRTPPREWATPTDGSAELLLSATNDFGLPSSGL